MNWLHHVSLKAILLTTLAGCGSRGNLSTDEQTERCEVGITRECTGPGACRGGQQCGANGEWGSCDCGNGTASPAGGQSSMSYAQNTTSGTTAPSTAGRSAVGGAATVTGHSSVSGSTSKPPQSGQGKGGASAAGSGGTTNGGAASDTTLGGTAQTAAGGTTSTVPNRAPSIVSVTFSPTSVVAGDYLWVNVKATDPDSDPITYTYAWTCDGLPAGSDSFSLSSSYFKRGTEIRVTVTPSDGELSGPSVTSDSVIVKNAAPSFSQYPSLSVYDTVDDASPLTCQFVATDADGDPLTYSYLWYVNDVPSTYTDSTLPATATSIGERWYCAVTVSDGSADGVLNGSSSQVLVATNVQGIIRDSTVWKESNSPYYLTSRIQIAATATLTIEPGVKVFGNGNPLEAWGNLSVVGTKEKPILLSKVNLTDNSTPQTPAKDTFAFVEFVDGAFFEPAQNASLDVRDCVFRNDWYMALYGLPETASHRFERNVFNGCGNIESESPVTLTNNVFSSGGNYCSPSIRVNDALIASNNSLLSGSDVEQRISVTIGAKSADLRNNYWGGLSDAEIPDLIFDNNDDLNVAGIADYLPTLTGPHADTPSPDATYFPDGWW